MAPYTIVLADDHVLFRQGVRRILEGAPDLEVVGEADDGLALLALLEQWTPHLVVLDIAMPQMRGLEAIPEIKAMHPLLKVLMLTMHKERAYLRKAMAAGANGYLLKEDAESDLFGAIDKVRQGAAYVSPRLSDALVPVEAEECQGDQAATSEVGPLTLRESQVLKLLAEGKSSREIAGLLGLSSRTVEHHRANMMAKLGVKGVVDLVKYAIAEGYL
ncbi:MAG: two component transcriptional regulator, LuxR family [candidate division NC10 bacterium]|nr:two component transcriptional regulator, LuxR family [candidate division NC10 bacterium]